jgi:signal transduction histidine kinase
MDTSTIASPDQLLSIFQGYSKQLVAVESVDDVVWLLAREVMGVLQLEDCVIYLLDPDQKLLIQRAAFGPKNPEGELIKDPIIIRPGDGIVGAAAALQRTENVGDTLLDPRYILDDEARRSELAVPIIYGGQTIGVIDSEHSQPHFFTEAHQSFIESIANITASKLAECLRSQQLESVTKALVASQKNIDQQSVELLSQKSVDPLRARKSLLSRMSHELRTPLNAIVGMSELLLLESEPAHAEPLHLIHEAGIHLNETVSLMLALMEFQGHEDVEEERKVVHLATYLDDRVANIAKPSSGYHLSIDTEGIEYVACDIRALNQILDPMIDNALKYDPTQELRIAASWLETADATTLCIVIEDNGPGVMPSIQSSLFEPFSQALPPGSSSAAGRGLGLALARAVADSRGWQLTLEHRPHGQGATLSVKLSAEIGALK